MFKWKLKGVKQRLTKEINREAKKEMSDSKRNYEIKILTSWTATKILMCRYLSESFFTRENLEYSPEVEAIHTGSSAKYTKHCRQK